MYDPISDSNIPIDMRAPDSFWAASPSVSNVPKLAPSPSANSVAKLTSSPILTNTDSRIYPRLSGSVETDVAIIGGGFTGLSTALHLRQHYGLSCAVIEANQPGWGASGRNGGFVLPGTGRLSVQQLQQKWGKETSQAIYLDYLDSVDSVKALIDQGIVCDFTQGGYLKIAHKPRLQAGLHAQAELLSKDYGDAIMALSAKQIRDKYIVGARSYGGIYYPSAFSVNPWLLAQGIAEKASTQGAQIFGNTALVKTEHVNGKHRIHTTNGLIKAKTLVLATNAYGQRKFHPLLSDRMFPVMSSILVTKPLSETDLTSLGMHKGLMVMDTRSLKYYYRLLPDNRLLFGGRGAIKGKDANKASNINKLFAGLKSTFPALQALEVDYFWSGWVSVSADNYPRIYHSKADNTLYSGGYCGAGLAFSIQAGKRLAQLICAPDELPELPYWQSPLKPFPMPGLRRTMLRAFYAWEGLK